MYICVLLGLPQGPCFLRLTNLVMEILSIMSKILVCGTPQAMSMDARGCCRLEFALRAANNHGPDQSSDNKKALLHSAKRLAEMNG
jgi:hypothetical protein